ncbi:Holliday junction resolvase RecU [Lysinibacillus sp. RS5]|uniref:Holliday junction resolvase RecU n=1 Tax=unclassified Lysinibacillus TaxID=2636778 RepID=UPI0035BE889D
MAVKNRSYANRGMHLERLLEMANNKYRNTGIADIQKLPTPVKIMKVTGSKVEGVRTKGHLVDYMGIYKGKSIIYDAKETGETSFPLKNIEAHQYKLLESWHRKGAVAFLIVYFKIHDKYYLLPFETLRGAWETRENGGRKSIARETFENECIEVKSKDGYTLHYLDALEV